jgi:hypothetical protein
MVRTLAFMVGVNVGAGIETLAACVGVGISLGAFVEGVGTATMLPARAGVGIGEEVRWGALPSDVGIIS